MSLGVAAPLRAVVRASAAMEESLVEAPGMAASADKEGVGGCNGS